MKYFVLIVTAVAIFSSCYKPPPGLTDREKYGCPGYDGKFLEEWFPYTVGDTLYFSDQRGERHWLSPEWRMWSREDSFIIEKDECIASEKIFADRDIAQNNKILFNVKHYIRSESKSENIILVWNSNEIHLMVKADGALGINEKYYTTAGGNNKKPGLVHHNNLILNTVPYTDVYEITIIYNSIGNTHKLYLAKNKGIIGYETKAGSAFWVED